jgi:hypothetical protein
MVAETSPGGSAAYVIAVDPGLSRPGCARNLEPVLFRQPLDGSARERSRTLEEHQYMESS